MTFLINGLFDSIISYKTHVGRKNQIDTGGSSIYKMCWFIYQLTVACRCCNIINLKACYIIFIMATPFEHFALESPMRIEQAAWLLFILVSRRFRVRLHVTEMKSHSGMKLVPGWKKFCLHVSFIRGWNLIWKKTSLWVWWKHKISHFSQSLKSEA